jgi:Alginate export
MKRTTFCSRARAARKIKPALSRIVILSAVFVSSAIAQLSAPPSTELFPPDTPGESHAATDLRISEPNQDASWLFPITRLNQLLPNWIQFGGQFRNRVESQDGLNFAPVNDVYDLTQLRLGIYIQPASWLKFVGVTQDSRVFFNHHVANANPYQEVWDIREAYAQLGSSTEGWIDVVGGRQMFSFGDERVIGPSDWSNMGRTFDTARVDLHHSGVEISIFAASVIYALDDNIAHHIEGNNIYGIYNSFTHLLPHTTIEPYLLWRVAPSLASLPETEGRGHLNEVTGGARVAGTLLEHFDYDVEMNKQTGSLGPDTIDAWAGHWNAGYTFEEARIHPRLFAEYNYASGNRNPNGNTWGTHDQIYASAHDKMSFADQFGWRNIEDIRAGADERAGKRWTLSEVVDDFWLATKNDAVYANSGAIGIAAHPGATSSHLGMELDLIAEFKQDRHVTYGFGFCHLFTGAYLNEATHGKDYNYPFAYLTYGL